MQNVKRMLAEMFKEGLISHDVELFLKNFFMSRLRLNCDIKERYITDIIGEMEKTKFGSGLRLNADYLTEKFKKLAPTIIAEGALGESISASDLEKIFFIFCQVHDATIAKN